MFGRKRPDVTILCPGASGAPPEQQTGAMLLAQITDLHSESVAIQNSFLAMTYIPLAFLGVMIYYAYQSSHSDLLFLLLPFLFSWCVYNLMKYTMKILGIDAYIRYLEEALNRLYGQTLFQWQSTLCHHNGYSVWGVLGQVPCFVALSGFLIYQFFDALSRVEIQSLFWLLLLAFLCQVVLLLAMGGFLVVHYFRVLKKARQAGL